MNGSSTDARTAREKKNFRCRSKASHMPRIDLQVTAAAVKMKVFLTVSKKIGLANFLVKLANPMKLAGSPTTLSVRAIQMPSTNGWALNPTMMTTAGKINA